MDQSEDLAIIEDGTSVGTKHGTRQFPCIRARNSWGTNHRTCLKLCWIDPFLAAPLFLLSVVADAVLVGTTFAGSCSNCEMHLFTDPASPYTPLLPYHICSQDDFLKTDNFLNTKSTLERRSTPLSVSWPSRCLASWLTPFHTWSNDAWNRPWVQILDNSFSMCLRIVDFCSSILAMRHKCLSIILDYLI